MALEWHGQASGQRTGNGTIQVFRPNINIPDGAIILLVATSSVDISWSNLDVSVTELFDFGGIHFMAAYFVYSGEVSVTLTISGAGANTFSTLHWMGIGGADTVDYAAASFFNDDNAAYFPELEIPGPAFYFRATKHLYENIGQGSAEALALDVEFLNYHNATTAVGHTAFVGSNTNPPTIVESSPIPQIDAFDITGLPQSRTATFAVYDSNDLFASDEGQVDKLVFPRHHYVSPNEGPIYLP